MAAKTQCRGEPALRLFKGWAVRLLEHVNRSWPHPHHKLNNSALDATPAQTVLPCLFSHLPTQLDIVLLEFGSMAIHLQLASVEAVARRLLMLRPRPLLLFLSVHAWCHASRSPGQPPVSFRRVSASGGHIYLKTVWAAAEAEATAVCERYGQARPCTAAVAALRGTGARVQHRRSDRPRSPAPADRPPRRRLHRRDPSSLARYRARRSSARSAGHAAKGRQCGRPEGLPPPLRRATRGRLRARCYFPGRSAQWSGRH